MSLDERLRSGLVSSADRGGLDADEVLASVELAHARGVARSRRARQAASIVVVLALFAGVAAVVSWRAGTDRTASPSGSYRSTATVRVGPAHISTPSPPGVELSDPRSLALAADTRRAALRAAHLATDDAQIGFHASLSARGDVLTLAATAPTSQEAEAVARAWSSAFVNARRAEAQTAISGESPQVDQRMAVLHTELQQVDAKLIKLNPVRYHNIHRYDAPNSNPSPHQGPPMGPVPESMSVHELNLANERVQILAELENYGSKEAALRIHGVTPQVFASIIAQTPAIQVKKASHPQSHAIAWWIVGLVIVLIGALLVYRRRVRPRRQLPA